MKVVNKTKSTPLQRWQTQSRWKDTIHRRHRLDIYPHNTADGKQGFKNADSSSWKTTYERPSLARLKKCNQLQVTGSWKSPACLPASCVSLHEPVLAEMGYLAPSQTDGLSWGILSALGCTTTQYSLTWKGRYCRLQREPSALNKAESPTCALPNARFYPVLQDLHVNIIGLNTFQMKNSAFNQIQR